MRLLTILCLVLISVHSYSQDVINENETVTRDSLIYHQLSTEPLTGTVVSFWDNGRLFTKIKYIDGKRVLYESFHNNGQLNLRQNHIDFKSNNPWETFYDNGQLEFRGNYKDGKKEGLHMGFHKNGDLWYRTNYIDGKKEGLHVSFDETGNLTSRETYKNGELVE